jgi:hypothetical protein
MTPKGIFVVSSETDSSKHAIRQSSNPDIVLNDNSTAEGRTIPLTTPNQVQNYGTLEAQFRELSRQVHHRSFNDTKQLNMIENHSNQHKYRPSSSNRSIEESSRPPHRGSGEFSFTNFTTIISKSRWR